MWDGILVPRIRNYGQLNRIAANSFEYMISLVALDLDGTTLNSEHAFSVQTKDTIRKLYSKNIRIAIATGRSFPALIPVIKSLDIPINLPIVCYNGCSAYDVRCDNSGNISIEKTHFEIGLTYDQSKKLIEFAVSRSYLVQVNS